MYLTPFNLVHFLLARGFISGDAVVAGNFVVLDAGRRNQNFKVICGPGRGLFIKQMREMQSDAMETLRREAACYEMARDDPTLSRLMPRLLAYDPARHLLIIELLLEAESLADYHARNKTWPAEIGRVLGGGLGLYHAQGGSILNKEAARSLFPRQVPVVLRLHSGGHAAISQYGRIGPAVSALIQQHPEFQSLLDAVGAEWRFDSLIHGDMKWDNVLVFPAPDGALDFRIVDWELADIGDADWDVGAVLQSFLLLWIQSMPIASGLPPEHYVGMAAQPIEPMRPVLGAFWQAYSATRGFTESKRKSALERSLRFGAARLVWGVLEQRLYATELDPVALTTLQVSFNILKRPEQAVVELLNV